VVQFDCETLHPHGVILTGAVFQAEGRIWRAERWRAFWDAPREIPHPAELRRVRDDASKDPNCTLL